MSTPNHGSAADTAQVWGEVRVEPAWAALLESVPVALYLDRADGTGLWVSERVEQLVGVSAADWLAGYDAWLERVHPDDRERVMDAARSFAETGQPDSDEYRVVLADGSVRWILDRALLRPDDVTGEALIHGVLLDVTEQHRLGDLERGRRAMLEELMTAESAQRSRLATELHDDSLQILVACLFELDRGERHLLRGDTAAALRAIEGARATLRAATDRTRAITFELRPLGLDVQVQAGPADESQPPAA